MGMLRSFAGYGKTAPYVPFAIPCQLANLDGYAAGGGWLQIHDLAAAASLTNGLVPLKSIYVAAAGALPSLFGELGTVTLNNGLCIAMSSTEATYTAVATSFDAEGEVSDWESNALLGTTLTTYANADGGAVWTPGNATKDIYRIDVSNGAAAATKRWLLIYANSVQSGPNIKLIFEVPLFTYDNPLQGGAGTVTNLVTASFKFGQAGLHPVKQFSYLGTGYGCLVSISSSGTTYVSSGDGAASSISIYYK